MARIHTPLTLAHAAPSTAWPPPIGAALVSPTRLSKRSFMAVRPGTIDGLFIIERPTLGDERGFFRESFRLSDLTEALGQAPIFVQENHSRSRRGTLRGLHAENWEKLVYAPHG